MIFRGNFAFANTVFKRVPNKAYNVDGINSTAKEQACTDKSKRAFSAKPSLTDQRKTLM